MLNLEDIIKDIQEEADEFTKFLIGQDIIAESNRYIPFVTGQLKNSVTSNFQGDGKGQVIWNMIYAEKIYFGIDFNFTKVANPNAQALWGQRAISENEDKWTKLWAEKLKKRQEGNL